jgi:hypothetical protein
MSVSNDLMSYVAGVLVVVFGVLGYTRGWRREVFTLGGLLVGWALVVFAGRPLIWFVDRCWLVLGFATGGGFDTTDANGLLRDLRAHPLIDPANPYMLYAATFVVVLGGAYFLSTRVAGSGGILSDLLGALIGLLNGYLVACALLVYVAPAFVGRELASTTALVGRYSTPALALGAGVVAMALIVVLRGRGAGSGRPTRARGR